MGWRVKVYFSDETEELVDDVFDSEEAAMEERDSWIENWGTGRSVLEEAGEDFCDADIDYIAIWEE